MPELTPPAGTVTREQAVTKAEKMRANHREVCRVMMPHADEEKLWQESTDTANVMARYILQPPPTPPADVKAFDAVKVAGDICERQGWNFDVIPNLATELTALIAGAGRTVTDDEEKVPAM